MFVTPDFVIHYKSLKYYHHEVLPRSNKASYLDVLTMQRQKTIHGQEIIFDQLFLLFKTQVTLVGDL